MQAVVTEILATLERSRASLREAAGRVRPQHREVMPASDRWSVAGILEHLALVDERFLANIGTKIAEARAAGLPPEHEEPAPLPPNLKAMLADRTERRSAPEPLHPCGLSYEDAWARAEAAREAVRHLVTGAAGVAFGRVIHEHPRFGALNVYQWGGFLAAHELRHAEQIREIAMQFERERASTAGSS